MKDRFGTVSGGVSAELADGNFWQGAAIGLVVSGLNHVAHRMTNPVSKLQSDPDPWDLNGDGILQKNEADNWYLRGDGKSITVDGNKIDLTGLDAEDLTYNSKTKTYSLSTTKAFIELPYETAATYGGSTFKLVDGKWQMQSQEYHYRMRPWNSAENVGRNILTIIGDPTQTIRPSQINTVSGQISPKGTAYFINIKY